MKLVVGLGNPGPKYTGTRHNVGFDVLIELVKRFSGSGWTSKFEGQIAEVQLGAERVLLLAPQTYMNLSGRSVRAASQFYKLAPEEILVVCDDLNLPVGKLRLRASGSAGGQKGLQNTIDQLGTQDFPRLRIGIDRPAPRVDAVNYVLQKFRKSEEEPIRLAIQSAVDAIETWANQGIGAAMNQFNRSAD